jgi:hypothetical protein
MPTAEIGDERIVVARSQPQNARPPSSAGLPNTLFDEHAPALKLGDTQRDRRWSKPENPRYLGPRGRFAVRNELHDASRLLRGSDRRWSLVHRAIILSLST